jgi:phospholipase/carboxylesterase
MLEFMRTSKEMQIGSLKCFVIEGAPKGPCVVLFHGYGADASDLMPLADIIGLSKNVTWVFPNAPLEVIIAPGFYGRAWYPIDNKRLEKSVMEGQPLDMSTIQPPGLENANRLANTLYDELVKNYSKVVLGGFSQGAMLATDVTLSQKIKPKGLVIMSGSLICKDRWMKMVKSCEGLPFVQTHGKNDAILGYEFAENLFNLLSESGLNGEFVSFNGGHEIPPKSLERINKFLSRILN